MEKLGGRSHFGSSYFDFRSNSLSCYAMSTDTEMASASTVVATLTDVLLQANARVLDFGNFIMKPGPARNQLFAVVKISSDPWTDREPRCCYLHWEGAAGHQQQIVSCQDDRFVVLLIPIWVCTRSRGTSYVAALSLRFQLHRRPRLGRDRLWVVIGLGTDKNAERLQKTPWLFNLA